MSCCSCGARGLLCFPPAVEFSLGGLRALLRHGNQPKEETNAGGKQRREREDKSRSWVCFLFLELVVFSLMKWNGMKKNKQWKREEQTNSPTQAPNARGKPTLHLSFLSLWRRKEDERAECLSSINQMEWRLIGCAARSFSCADMPR